MCRVEKNENNTVEEIVMCCQCEEQRATHGDLCGDCDAAYWEAVHSQDDIIRENVKLKYPDIDEDALEDMVDHVNWGGEI